MSDSKLYSLPAGLLARDRIGEAPVEWRGALSRDAPVWDAPGLDLRADPVLDLRAQGGRRGEIHVSGHMAARVAVPCRRCLEETIRDVEVALDLRFVPGLPAWEEEEGLYSTDPNVPDLELEAALREELLLALPAFPLCRPDCRGLCPRCGADRNEEECDCAVEETDPRWQALRELKHE